MGVAHDAFSVRSFLDDGDQRVILESDRGIDPKEPTGGVGHPNSGVLRLSYRPYSPRAVTRSPPAVGGEGDLAVADLQHPLSLIHISEPTRLGMISYAVFC